MKRLVGSLLVLASIQTFVHANSKKIVNKPVQNIRYYSEFGQDKFLNEQIFKNKKNGVFFDIGAYDGVFASNSYFFEKALGWTGICVEPLDEFYRKLTQDRKCVCIHGAIAATSCEREFVKVSEKKPTFSGFLSTIEPQHWPRIVSEGKEWQVIKVKTFTFNELCKLHEIKHVDYLSIDTEGSEEEIIRSIDFENIDISIVDVENNFGNTTMRKYLESKGYRFINRLGMDDVYIKS